MSRIKVASSICNIYFREQVWCEASRTVMYLCYVLLIALSIYHVSNAGELTRLCKESNGQCGRNTDLSCNSMFGPEWIEKGKCCDSKPCCVALQPSDVGQCEDIQHIPNGKLTKTGISLGSSCDTRYQLIGDRVIECTGDGWSNFIPICYGYPETIVFFNGSTYKFNEGFYTWFGAKNYCIGQGGNLTSIETEEENKYLEYVATLIGSSGQLYTWWIGLSYINDKGSFEWLSGNPLTYTNWYQGSPRQPDNAGSLSELIPLDCASIQPFFSFQWSNEGCTTSFYQAIC